MKRKTSRQLPAVLLLLAVLGALASAQESTPAPVPAAGPADLESWPLGAPSVDAGPATIPGPGLADALQMLLALAVVVALVVAIVWMLKRFAPRTVRMYSSDNLKVLARAYVGPKQSVCLLKAPGKLLVVGATQEAVSLLTEITDPAVVERVLGEAEAASSKSASAVFREMVSGIGGARARRRTVEEELAAAVTSVSDRFTDFAKRLDRPR